MSSIHLRRAAAVISGALLAVMLIGPASVSASPPGWEFQNQALLPTTVSPGSSAGYTFRIHNGGKSNISQLYLTDSIPNAAPTFFTNSRGTTCQQSPTLFCSFGALNSGDSIDVTVAYATPGSGSSFKVTFQLNASGASFNDKGGNSHGDTLSQVFTTALNSAKNFNGRFALDLTDVATDPALSKKNPQASKVTPPATLIPVTVEDGLTAYGGTGSDPCGTSSLAHCIGDWARLNVNDGNAGPVKVTLTLYGPSVPNGATTTNIVLFHEGSSPNPISTPCSAATLPTGTGECITVTKVGNNFQIVAWLNKNGYVRGGY